MARPRGTDGSLLASLPWTLGALLISLAPHVPFLPFWITIAFVGCAIWRYLIEKHRRTLPSTWLRAALALGCFLGVLATYSSISGVGPGSALLAVMAALKLLETRQRRDQFVLLFLSVFLVMSIAAARTVHMVVAVHDSQHTDHHDCLAAYVSWKVRDGSSEFCHRRASAFVCGAAGNCHVGVLPAYLDTILGRAYRYQSCQLRT